MKATVRSAVAVAVWGIVVGAASAATLEEWRFDQMDSFMAVNEIATGPSLRMQCHSGAWVDSNLYAAGGPFPESYGVYRPNTNQTYNRAYGTTDFNWGNKTNLTMEFWLKPGTPISGEYAFPINVAEAQIWLYCWNGVNYQFTFAAQTTDGFKPTNLISPILPNNVWTHIAITWDGTTIRGYTNGVEIPAMAGPYPYVITNYLSTIYIDMGSANVYPFGKLRGDLDDIRVSDVALLPGDGSGNGCLAWNKSLSPARSSMNSYVDGSKINLAVVDGAVASCTPVYYPGYGGAAGPQYPTYAQYDWFAGVSYGYAITPANPAWWKLALPDTYNFRHYDISWDWIVGSNFTVETSMNGVDWTTQATITGNTNTTVSGDLSSDVPTKFIRLQVTGTIGGDGAAITLRSVRFTGNNSTSLNRRISVAQNSWAGGNIYAVGWQRPYSAIDDGARDLAHENEAFVQSATPTNYSLIVALNGRCTVDRIGFGQFWDIYHRGTRDVDVYTSPDSGGTNWVLVKQVRDLPESADPAPAVPYTQYTLDSKTIASRVKFQILRNWELPVTYNITYISQLYVFPVPPPSGTIFSIR